MPIEIAPITYIGDRPAQMCALVMDADLTYTTDRADPFMVQRIVERYNADNHVGTVSHNFLALRRVVLSTGLMWAPKYDGMVAKQITTLLMASFVTPLIFVLPVSTRTILGHAINIKLAQVCVSSQSRRDHTMFCQNGFAGDETYPTQPTPVEVLALVRGVESSNPRNYRAVVTA